ncbi:MAG: glutamate-5-semialdehyde dehydrogenase [Myxococcota bacterium]|nr:glutamate-5-semialdehyde dehydrogenase [Myxococcota bacterium]
MTTSLKETINNLTRAARACSPTVARASAHIRTSAINAMAQELRQRMDLVVQANGEDLRQAETNQLSAAMKDRLRLDQVRIENLAIALENIAAQRDPVGTSTQHWTQENGLEVHKVRLPLGVIMMIYESRPNVTLDAAALCLRSGNTVILRGGKEAFQTNQVFGTLIADVLKSHGLPECAVQLVPTTNRAAVPLLLQASDHIDLVIPRGGESLIRNVVAQSRIPVVQHYQGICHVYIDGEADPVKAKAIAYNAKVQRPGVCNAMETLLIDKAIAETILPEIVAELEDAGVEIRACLESLQIAPNLNQASESDWDTEFLDLVLAIRLVGGLEGAIAHIDRHGSNHTASIVTENLVRAEQFLMEVDASCVLHNASTRFNDGGELGLGAEMGISTTRIHAYGPMGVDALTAEKFVVRGKGHIRT